MTKTSKNHFTNVQMMMLNTFIARLELRYHLTLNDLEGKGIKLVFADEQEVNDELDRIENKWKLVNYLAVPFSM